MDVPTQEEAERIARMDALDLLVSKAVGYAESGLFDEAKALIAYIKDERDKITREIERGSNHVTV